MTFRFHIVALPHTQTRREFCTCAFTRKVFYFCRMMRGLGHTVLHYGVEGSNPDCDEHVTVLTADQQRHLAGPWNAGTRMHAVTWNPNDHAWRHFNVRAAAEILQRIEPRDFLCLCAGLSQKPIADAVGNAALCVEVGVGYTGMFAPYKIFESYAHMHYIYGRLGADADGHFYDCVIPNTFDPAEWPFEAQKDDYYLYIGRLVRRKGIQVAVDAVRAVGGKLLIAGPGCTRVEGNRIHCDDGSVYQGDHIEYVGCADHQQRTRLMGGARAVLVPTLYIEPFGCVVTEAQMCGTPVISTDWGAFPETVEHGRTGYRCRTLEQFVWAARNVQKLDPRYIRRRAEALYSIDRARPMYHEYFSMLYDLWEQGWYTERPREQLDWLALPRIGEHRVDEVLACPVTHE